MSAPVTSIYELLELIRPRPALYLGRQSLSALSSFLNGYQAALLHNDLRFDWGWATSPFHHLHDWAARRFGWPESTAGWCNIILAEVKDEGRALDVFFDLLDEFKQRRPALLGSVRLGPRHQPTGVVRRYCGTLEEPLPPPAAIRVIRYVPDGGCYLYFRYANWLGEQEEGYFSSLAHAIEQVRRESQVKPEEWDLPADPPAVVRGENTP
jgi:hypothetical protein